MIKHKKRYFCIVKFKPTILILEKQQNPPNLLINSLSPYLLQHAYNPVHWHEWGALAFEKAEKENKPMLISIGYSACHWCHVMAHESFEDYETAEIMNQYFVCIKIDREELPDVDQIYMDACQLLNGSGGWPLNAFTLPNKKPLHALTYLPKDQWQKLLFQINDLWQNKKDKALEYAEKLSQGILKLSDAPIITQASTNQEIAEKAFVVFKNQYDSVYGGPDRAPKFPLPNNYEFLLNYYKVTGNEEAKQMALYTLKQMALGGIHDAVGGGFARYSVDKHWFAPHFEKMLYDNTQLLSLYSKAYIVSKNPFYQSIAHKILTFCNEALFSKPSGLYFSALDADSEGEEGLYYTYTFNELKAVLGDNCDIFTQYFQCTEVGNWEHGRNILYALDTIENMAVEWGMDVSELSIRIKNSLAKLKKYRSQRVKPGLDDKCIGSWNNLMLKALAESAIYLKDETILKLAETLADNILLHFFKGLKLQRIYKNEQVKIEAFLEDYATLIDALITLYQSTLNEKYLLKAKNLCDYTFHYFFNIKAQFFQFNALDAEVLIAPKFDINDDVINSSNSMMAHNVWRLGWYFNDSDYQKVATTMLSAMNESIEKHAPWYSHWAALQLFSEFGTHQIVVSAEELSFNERIQIEMPPNSIIALAHPKSEIPMVFDKLYKEKNSYYHCLNKVCYKPKDSIEELNESLKK